MTQQVNNFVDNASLDRDDDVNSVDINLGKLAFEAKHFRAGRVANWTQT